MKQPGLLVDSALEFPVYLLEFLARLDFELKAEILQQQLPFLYDALQCESYILECERFGEEIRSPFAHGLDRVVHGWKAAHHDYRKAVIVLLYCGQKLKPVHVRQAQVYKRTIECFLVEHLEGFDPGQANPHSLVFQTEQAFLQKLTEHYIVFHDQNFHNLPDSILLMMSCLSLRSSESEIMPSRFRPLSTSRAAIDLFGLPCGFSRKASGRNPGRFDSRGPLIRLPELS